MCILYQEFDSFAPPKKHLTLRGSCAYRLKRIGGLDSILDQMLSPPLLTIPITLHTLRPIQIIHTCPPPHIPRISNPVLAIRIRVSDASGPDEETGADADAGEAVVLETMAATVGLVAPAFEAVGAAVVGKVGDACVAVAGGAFGEGGGASGGVDVGGERLGVG